MVAPGERVFGKYEVLRRLAVGGMGEIFLSRQTGVIDRLVILKNLLPQLASDPQAVAAFLDEARILGCVNHPNVVALFDVGEWDGTHFHAMEYINGVDVSQLVKHCEDKGTRLPPHVSAQIVREAALGLDAAHIAQDATGAPLHIVHRDISPHNLMVRADGLCKVVDFGVAVAENRSQKTDGVGLLKGKLGYMAPEQIKGAPAEPKCDQFSLGVVLWELLTQRRLFTGENAAAIFTKIIKEPVAAPSTVRPDVPPELDAVVLRMTAQEPVERYARLNDAALALRKALDALKVPDNATAQFIRATVGPELATRVKDLAAPAPARIAAPTSSGRIAPETVFCGSCGTPSPPGDRFCRSCGKPIGSSPTPGGTPAAGVRVGTPSTGTPSGTHAAGADTAGRGLVDDHRSGSSTGIPRLDVMGTAPRAVTGGFRLEAPLPAGPPAATPSPVTRVPTAIAPPAGELAVVTGVVEQFRGGVVVSADADALSAAWNELAALARNGGAIFEHLGGPRFSLAFGGDRATAEAVAIARGNVRLSARIGRDVLLRIAVVSDGSAPLDYAPRLRAIGERLVAHAAPGASVITEDARVRSGGDVVTGRSGSVAQPDGTTVLAHDVALPRRLAGRAAELAALDALLDDAARGGRTLSAMVVGDGGAGKTVLSQSAAAFARDRGFVVGLARGARVAGAATFDVLRQLLKSACLDLLARERATGTWSRALDLIGVPALHAARIRAVVDDDGDGGLSAVPFPRRRAAVKSAMVTFFDRLSERSPLLIVVDDFDRADAASLELVADLGQRIPERRLAVVVVGRPAAGEKLFPQARRVIVGPLAAPDIIAVAGLALGAAISPGLAHVLAAQTQGEPLAAVALLRWLGASGAIAMSAQGVDLTMDVGRMRVPAGAAALLQGHHSLLPHALQAVLRSAAGFGQIVEAAHVAHVAEGVADVAGAFRQLVDIGVLEPAPEDRYAFRSNVEWEVAAASDDAATARRRLARRAEVTAHALSTRFRLDMAERLADALVALDALDHVVDTSLRVATCCELFGMYDWAADHWRRVLHAELRRSASAPSAESAARALHCAARATACLLETNPSAAVDVVLPALSLVRAAPRVAADALRQRAIALARRKRFVDAEGGFVQALELLATADDDAVACDILVDLAGVLEQRGDDDAALQRAEEALRRFASARAAQPTLAPDRGFDAFLLYSRLIARRGRGAEAKATLRRALDSVRAVQRPVVEGEVLLQLATLAQGEGDVDGALKLLEEAVAVAIVDAQLEARALQQLGRLLQSLARRDDAHAAFVRALVAAQRGFWDEGVPALQQQVASLKA